MSEEEDFEEPDEDEADTKFPLSAKERKILRDFASKLRGSLAEAEPHFIRSAATGIFVIERLPKPTPGAQVELGYRTPNSGGNYGWADLVISEDEIRACLGEHFYDPGVGGDTETRVLFEAGLGEGARNGSLEYWHAQARELALHGLYVEDESEDIDWTIDDLSDAEEDTGMTKDGADGWNAHITGAPRSTSPFERASYAVRNHGDGTGTVVLEWYEVSDGRDHFNTDEFMRAEIETARQVVALLNAQLPDRVMSAQTEFDWSEQKDS
jgi:hypothetical protein